MVRIITDSAADFEPHELQELDIACIPLVVTFEDTPYEENVNLSKDLFYQLLSNATKLPKTSQASPTVLMNLFEDAKSAGDEAIYFCLSSAISGTYQSALTVKDMVDYDGCFVVDSLNATGGQRMIVEYAVKLRGEGKNARQIMEGVKTMQHRIVLYACMDTLENLYMGGRISQLAYNLGSIAKIKPIIHVDPEGRITVPAKVIGMRRGIDWLCTKAAQQKADAAFPFYVMYTDKRQNGRILAQYFEKEGYAVPEERIIQVGAAIGTHVGPNAIGFVYVAEE